MDGMESGEESGSCWRRLFDVFGCFMEASKQGFIEVHEAKRAFGGS